MNPAKGCDHFDFKAQKIVLLIVSLFVLWVCLIAFSAVLSQPFRLDEAHEALTGLALSRMGPKAFMPGPIGAGMELTHPLLYTFTQSFIQRIFGPAEFPLRMYGVMHFLLSLCVSLAIISRLINEKRFLRNIAFGLCALLYIANPLLIQHSVVINADNNILTTAILVFIYFFARFEKYEGRRFFLSRFILAVLLALCFWSKELAPAFMIVGILFYRLLNRDFKKLGFDFFCVGLCGFLIFWLTWWLYCACSGLDTLAFVRYTLINKGRIYLYSLVVRHYLFEFFFSGLRWHIYWVSAPFFAILLIFLVMRVGNFLKEKKAALIDFIFIIACAIWLPFQFFKPRMDMMKYHYPAYPLFIIIITWLFVYALRALLAAGFKPSLGKKKSLIFCVFFFILVWHYYLLGDYLLPLSELTSLNFSWVFLASYYLPMVCMVVCVMILVRKILRKSICVIVVVLFILPVNTALTLNQAKADYATVEIWGNYGEKGFWQALDYLKNHLKDDSIVAIRSDFAYYLVNRFGRKITNVEFYELYEVLDNPVVSSKIPYEVLGPFVLFDLRALLLAEHFNRGSISYISRYYELEKIIGSFVIFHKREKVRIG